MKRKKFCKMLMAAGISRNTATEAADAANRQGLSLFKVQGRILNMRGIFLWRLVGSKHMRKEFDRAVLNQARLTPRRIRPLKAKRRYFGVSGLGLVDEMHLMPSSVAAWAVEQIRQKSPAELAQELPAPGLWPKVNPHINPDTPDRAIDFLEKNLNRPRPAQGGVCHEYAGSH